MIDIVKYPKKKIGMVLHSTNLWFLHHTSTCTYKCTGICTYTVRIDLPYLPLKTGSRYVSFMAL